jgi:hypothetical protein
VLGGAPLAASSCTAAIAACSWEAPSEPLDKVAVTSAAPSALESLAMWFA